MRRGKSQDVLSPTLRTAQHRITIPAEAWEERRAFACPSSNSPSDVVATLGTNCGSDKGDKRLILTVAIIVQHDVVVPAIKAAQDGTAIIDSANTSAEHPVGRDDVPTVLAENLLRRVYRGTWSPSSSAEAS